MANCGMPCRKFVVPSSGSTIQRCCGSLADRLARFLHEEAVARARAMQLGADDLLGAMVGGRDEIGRPLARDLQVLDLAEVALQPARRLGRGADHDVQDCRAGHSDFMSLCGRRRVFAGSARLRPYFSRLRQALPAALAINRFTWPILRPGAHFALAVEMQPRGGLGRERLPGRRHLRRSGWSSRHRSGARSDRAASRRSRGYGFRTARRRRRPRSSGRNCARAARTR